MPVTEIDYDLECDVCGKLTKRRCSIGQKDSFCSEWCQQKMSSSHRFKCSSGPLTTADYLARAVYSDEIPDDPQTVEDYGFSRCKSWNEKSHLLGLYIGLIKVLEVRPVDLDQWRRDGKLVENIVAEFNKRPKQSRGAYFPWFMKHTYLLNESASDGDGDGDGGDSAEFVRSLESSRSSLPQDDRTKEIWDLQPITKRDSYIAYAIYLDRANPHPAWVSTDLDIWYELGFLFLAMSIMKEVSAVSTIHSSVVISIMSTTLGVLEQSTRHLRRSQPALLKSFGMHMSRVSSFSLCVAIEKWLTERKEHT